METQKTSYLVTGATGYVGSVLVKQLCETGHNVTSLVMPGDDAGFVSRYSVIRYADVLDPVSLEESASGFDLVIHLAGIVDVGTGNFALMRRVNIKGTRNVAELCLRHRMRMLHCSSVHAIPCPPDSSVMTETRDFDPHKVKGTYGKTKAEATGIVLEMMESGLDAMIAFPSGIIGPYERRISNIGQVVIDILCDRLNAYIDGQYNFVDVRDVVNGICGMLNHWKPGECYILSGHEVSVENMLAAIAGAGGRKTPRIKIPYWLAMFTSYFSELYYSLQGRKPLFSRYSLQTLRSNCRFSNHKACTEIGFSARDSRESLSDMTRWITEHFVEKKGGAYKSCFFRE